MAKTVTFDQVRASFMKDIDKGFAKLARTLKKCKTVAAMQEAVAHHVDDYITDKTINMAVKFDDQENY